MKRIKMIILRIGMLLRCINSIQLTLVLESHSLGRPIVTGDQFVAMETATTVLRAASPLGLAMEKDIRSLKGSERFRKTPRISETGEPRCP